MTMSIRAAKRSEAKPLIGIFAESGKGKTYSALLLARGFAGPNGKIIMIETEGGRGEAYADPAEYPEIGGYDVISMRDDFSPSQYSEAISLAESAAPDVLVIDSASHEWEGVGGVLDMAAKREADGKKGMLIWQKPKIDHQKHFMLRFQQTPIPLVILCMRAKYPMIMSGREPVRSKELEPKQSDDILYEMSVHGWIDDNHVFHLKKSTQRALIPIFGGDKKISVETGAQLKEWASGALKPASTTKSTVTEKTPEQIFANKIAKAVTDCPPDEIADLMNRDEMIADLEKVKASSQAAYDYIVDLAKKKNPQ